jgi:DNA-binding winged helix-turn-helix (wHTH) protein/TolB-like protein/Tfp pilus assembly protein PilF
LIQLVELPGLQIGEWRADRTTNELVRAGNTVRVEPKAMEVLMVLAERAGRVVSREDLLAAVWPGVIVGDEALTQSVIKLRRALDDNPRSPAYIETISKRGYRLIAPVRKGLTVPQAGEAGEPAAQQAEPAGISRRGRWLGAVAGLTLVLAVAGVYFLQAERSPGPAESDADAFDLGDGRREALVTITVLPFDSLGSDARQAYLARGISSDLMTDLSRLSGLRLISASESPAGAQPARTARYVVSGTVQREADMLRVNIRLTDARTNEQLWAERFERPFGDLFTIQNEISRRLVEQLPARLGDAERRRLATRYTRNLEAYDRFLRGQALFLVRRVDENEQARAYYRSALELDPEFARAYAGLAMTYAMDYRLQGSPESSAALTRAFELAEAARLIDPEIPEIYWALGFVHVQSRRHEQAILFLQKAIELNRSYADAYALMGGIHTYIGQPAKSVPLLRTALRLNPGGGHLYFLILGRAYLFENDIEQALINLREAIARNPVNVETRLYLAAALVAAGDQRAAEWEAEEIRTQEPGFSTRNWLETYPLTGARERARLLELLAEAGL